MPLSDTAIRTRKPAAKPIRMTDGDGLYLLLQPNGARWWRFDYRRPVTGKPNTLSLGTYPEVSLAMAREKRDELRRLRSQGIDPGAHRQSNKVASSERAANSFEVVALEFLAVKAKDWTPGNYAKQLQRLRKHSLPWLGALPMAEIGVGELRPVIERISERQNYEQAHRVLSQLSAIFKFAVATRRAERDWARDLVAILPARRKGRFPTMTDPKEIGGILRAIEGYNGSFTVQCALKLAPMLFVRPGELRGARWEEIELDHPDGARWVIPAMRRKLRLAAKTDPATSPHIVPLPKQAQAILTELHNVSGRREHLFPGERDPQRSISDNTLNAALRRLGYRKDEIVAHGFRHMASTLLNEMGFRADAIEQQLSHVTGGVRGVYNLATYLPERYEMMQAWADYLTDLRDGTSNVLRFPQRAA